MNQLNRRKYNRQKALNLLDYEILDSKGHTLDHGMGRTRNVSVKGLLLETHIPVEEGYTVLVTIGLEEEVVEIKGKIVYVKHSKSNRYRAGLEFLEMDRKGSRVLKKYLQTFEADQAAA